MCRANIRSDSEKNNEDTKRKKFGWRRGWDSNPRDPFGPNGFQDRRSQPLSYPSVVDIKSYLRRCFGICAASLLPKAFFSKRFIASIFAAGNNPMQCAGNGDAALT